MSEPILTIDGSHGEGGGQVLRSSLAMSLVTGRPVIIDNIRARRKKPGLRRQHLTAVCAAAEISSAEVSGAEIGSSRLEFRPGKVMPGDYTFRVGTAGSTTLVLQTVLPALLLAEGPSDLTLEGGTHNPFAPPWDFLAKTYLPLVGRIGPTVETELIRPGFYPAGGGQFTVRIQPARQPTGRGAAARAVFSAAREGDSPIFAAPSAGRLGESPFVPQKSGQSPVNGYLGKLELMSRGELAARRVRALVANLPRHIAERECRTIAKKADWDDAEFTVEEVSNSRGPGNVVLIEMQFEHVTEVFTAFGQIGVRAETVALRALGEARTYLAAGVPVGRHLADQLLLPLGIGAYLGSGGGAFRTTTLSQHATTHIDLLHRFLEIAVGVEQAGQEEFVVRVR